MEPPSDSGLNASKPQHDPPAQKYSLDNTQQDSLYGRHDRCPYLCVIVAVGVFMNEQSKLG